MKYKAHFRKIIESIVEIEADNRSEAHDIACSMDNEIIEENQKDCGWVEDWIENISN
jgi:hypothetical protein